MNVIDEGEGVFRVEFGEGEHSIPVAEFYRRADIVELHLPNGVEEIGERAFCFCHNLKKLYMPSSVKRLGKNLFYGITKTEVIFDGTEEEFLTLAKPYKKFVQVQVPGPYDKQPYCNTDGTYYEEREQWQYFDGFCRELRVNCKDDKQLYYGYSNPFKGK